MHFYPGVAEYAEPGKDPYRIFINEDTIRSMSPTFAGRPIFVEHVEDVEPNVDELRKEADGWVVESFFNAADGKTWAKFVIVSERGFKAIQKGFKLSNAYVPRAFGQGGLWNGVTYAKEVTAGEFEHLAIVRNPRYEESTILTPDEFKQYNSKKEVELKKLANSKEERGATIMFFKKTKVENSKDLESMSVTLPKSGKEMTVIQLVNEMDKIENMHGYASDDHMVKVGDKEMSVKNLVKSHVKMNAEMEDLKKKKEDGTDVELEKDDKEIDVEGDMHNEEESEDEPEKKEKKREAEEKKEVKKEEKGMKNETDKKETPTKKEKTEHFDALRNAQDTVENEVAHIELMEDQVARGRVRYGS